MHTVRGSSILVTGGCGFIGSCLVRSLCQRGAAKIRVIDNFESGNPRRLQEAEKHVEIIRFSLGQNDSSDLLKHLSGVDYVFHLAAEKHNQSRQNPLQLMRTNIDGTYSLLNAAHLAGIEKIVFTSSLYAYGRTSAPPFVESEALVPTTVYGISKAAGEFLHRFAESNWRLPYNIARLLFIYGPGQYAGTGYKSVIVKNFERIRRGEPPVVLGDGKQSMDYLYVNDSVSALIKILESGTNREIYNVGSGKTTAILDLVEAMLRVAKSPLKIAFGPADETAGSFRVGNINKIQQQLEWSPSTSLEEGLHHTYDWVRNSDYEY